MGTVFPIGFSFAISRVLLGHGVLIVSVEYLLSRIFLFGSFNFLTITMFQIVIIALYYFVINFWNIKRKLLFLSFAILISSTLSLYYSLVGVESLLWTIFEVVIQVLSALYFYKFFNLLSQKFLFFKFGNLDSLYFSLMVLLLSVGAFNIKFIAANLGLFLSSATIIFCVRVFSADKFFIISSMMALGAVCATGNEMYLILSVIASLCLVSFKSINKYIFALISVIVFGLLGMVLKLQDYIQFISFVVAIVVYVCVPNKLLYKLSLGFDQDSFNIVFERLESDKVAEIRGKLFKFSNTLHSIQKEFKYLIVGKIDRRKASEELVQDVINACCRDCENFKNCFFQTLNKKAMFENLLARAIENKQITKDDLSNGIQTYCTKSEIVLSEINQVAAMYLSYEQAMKSDDISKLLIADEMANFSDIFKNFAKMLKNEQKINKNKSKSLKEALINNLIDVKEIVAVESETGLESVSVVACNENILKKELIETIEKKVRNKLKVKNIEHLSESGLSLAKFVPKNKLKVQFAVASRAKEEKNGDNIVVSKLTETKYFVAIADGMGHGESASRISSMVLSLIRSMFEVGLDDELIMSSVNKLLIPAGLDNFTTLDACIINLEENSATFIKLGATVSIVKHGSNSEVVSCSSLPIGIVKNVKPTVVKKNVYDGDILFLCSDGVVDSFSNISSFSSFINDSKVYDLQKFVDSVLYDATASNVKHLDDMSIIAVKLLKN